MTLYKYSKPEHVDAFFKSGKLRIGNLHWYRNEEALGNIVGDTAEGTSTTTFSLPNGAVIRMDGSTLEAQYLASAAGGVTFGSGGTVTAIGPNAGVTVKKESRDLYVFCCTNEYSEHQMKKFGGACFEIVSPDGFFDAISTAICGQAIFEHVGPVSYIDRETTWNHPHQLPECLIKPKIDRYIDQKEVRAIWIPHAAKISPMNIEVPEAIKHCRPFLAK
jgi:hypothetical protein